MRHWYCAKCRMTFRVKSAHGNAERHGCPECYLWFASATGQGHATIVSVTPEDLAQHKASISRRDGLNYRYLEGIGDIGVRAVEETA